MQLLKNIGVGQNKLVHNANCFGPNDAIPNKSDVVNDFSEGRSVSERSLPPSPLLQTMSNIQQQKTHIDNAKTKHPNTTNAPRPAPTPIRDEEIQQLRASLGDNILKRRNIDATIESVMKCLKDLECDVIEGKKEQLHYYAEWKGWKRTAFLKRSKDIIIANSLATARALDSDVQSVIFGTMKTMDHKIGLKITDKQLAAAVPG
eukprot:scaffold76306_cov40-Cyclotella_meneghiniana.AAC.4